MPLLQIEGLSKAFGGLRAINGLDIPADVKQKAITHLAVGYSVTYLFGSAGVTWFLSPFFQSDWELLALGREPSELFDRLHSRYSGELQIDQHDIRAHVDHEFDRVLPGCGLADELKSAAR